LSEALMQLALDGPPQPADSLLRYAVSRRPGSARYRELAAVAALRAGHCDEAAAGFVELLDFGIERENGPALVRECWAGRGGLTGAAPTPDHH
jgi:cytochrome c-type biogenesis protein CcmH/NrfG